MTVPWDGNGFGSCATVEQRPAGNGTVCGNRKKLPEKYTIRLTELYLAARKADRSGRLVKRCGSVEELAVRDRAYRTKLFSYSCCDGKQTEEAGWMLKQLRLMLEGESPRRQLLSVLTTLYDKREEEVWKRRAGGNIPLPGRMAIMWHAVFIP
ncbi:MAG: hypothetical protein ACLURV_10065 [Gallintestinimicrobium sp.]